MSSLTTQSHIYHVFLISRHGAVMEAVELHDCTAKVILCVIAEESSSRHWKEFKTNCSVEIEGGSVEWYRGEKGGGDENEGRGREDGEEGVKWGRQQGRRSGKRMEGGRWRERGWQRRVNGEGNTNFLLSNSPLCTVCFGHPHVFNFPQVRILSLVFFENMYFRSTNVTRKKVNLRYNARNSMYPLWIVFSQLHSSLNNRVGIEL